MRPALPALLILVFASTASAAPEPWMLPEGLIEPAVATDGSRIFIFGGAQGLLDGKLVLSDQIYVVDPKSGEVTLAGIRLPERVLRPGVAATSAGFVVAGGERTDGTRSDRIFSIGYDLQEFVEHGSRLPDPVSAPAILALADTAYVVGGYVDCTASCPAATTAVVKITRTDAQPLFSLPEARTAGVLVNSEDRSWLVGSMATGRINGPDGKVFALSFEDGGTVDSRTIEEASIGRAALIAVGPDVILLGGLGERNAPHTASTIDPVAGTIEALTSNMTEVDMPEDAAGVAVGNKLFVIGGSGCPDAFHGCRKIHVFQSNGTHLTVVEETVSSEKPRPVPGIEVTGFVLALSTAGLLRQRR